MLASLEDIAQAGEDALASFQKAVEDHSECCDALIKLQQRRAVEKTAALCRMVEEFHPAVPEKKYTLTQAADCLQLDPQYAAYKAQVVEAEQVVREAADQKEACRLEVELRIAELKGSAGVR